MLKFLSTIAVVLWIVVGMAELVSLAPAPVNKTPVNNTKAYNECAQNQAERPSAAGFVICKVGHLIHRTREDTLAISTFFIMVFTAVLSVLNRSLAKSTRIAADAARLSAEAAVGTALPLMSMSVIRLDRIAEGMRGPQIVGHPEQRTLFHINFKNFGQSPAEMIVFCLEWRVTRKLPDIPIYESSFPFTPGTLIENGKTIPDRPFFGYYPITLQSNEVEEISSGTVFLWVYGYLRFRDTIIGDTHETRFCAKWQAYTPGPDGSLVPIGFVHDSETPQAYTKRARYGQSERGK
jgi:hypothetical protein